MLKLFFAQIAKNVNSRLLTVQRWLPTGCKEKNLKKHVFLINGKGRGQAS